MLDPFAYLVNRVKLLKQGKKVSINLD